MKTLLSALLVLGLGSNTFAADWPQWLGPNRDGHSPEKGLLKQWPKQGPALAWTFKDTGVGYSSPAVVGDRLYILGARGDDEYLLCLDAAKGAEVWKARVGPKFDFKGNQWGAGPRSTPCVANGHVYALGGAGDLVCVMANGGGVVWQKNMGKDLQGEVNPIGGGPDKIGWGYSWSPLVDGDKLICYPGGPQGAVAALNCKTGNVLWRSKDLKEQASYSSPVVAEFGGVRQYVVLHNKGLAGVDAKNGDLLWTWDKKPAYSDVVIPTPLVLDEHIYISAGFRPATCELVKVSQQGGKFTATKVYKLRDTRVMKNLSNGSVIVGKHAYGYSENIGWVCQEVKSGKEVWGEKAFGPGSVITADGNLYCYDENSGAVALAEASPEGWTEKGKFTLPDKTKLKAPSGRNWTPPVIANGHLFLRDQELLFCYKIK